MFLQKQQVSCFLGCAALAVTLSAHPGWPQAGGDKKADPLAAQDDPNRELLRLAKLPTDGPGLLKLLDKLGGKDEDLLRLDQLIAQLGDLQFAKRTDAAKKIVALNQAAIAGIKTAQLSKDAEIASRAKDCLKDIYKSQKLGIPLTAVRVLARLKPDGLAEALLHFLPYTAEEEVQEEVWFTLYDLVKEAPRLLPLLEKALGDPLPARRAVAGCVLGRLGSKAQQTAVAKLLTDADPHVRLRSAQGLLAGKNLVGVRTLIELLEQPAVEISWSAEELLHYLAGEEAPAEKVGAASAKERLASRKAWEAWWRERQSEFSFADVDRDYRRPRLFFVINSVAPTGDETEFTSKVTLCGCAGTARWQLTTSNGQEIRDVQLLPANRLLVTGWCPPGIPVSECDLRGKTLWNPKITISRTDDEGNIITETIDGNEAVRSCRRLPNGNTFLALGHSHCDAIEINPEGEQVRITNLIAANRDAKEGETTSAAFVCHSLLSNGRIFGVAGSEPFAVAEFDAQTGKEIRRVSIKKLLLDMKATSPITTNSSFQVLDVLADGHCLIRLRSEKQFNTLELDARGQVRWKGYLDNASVARRLRDGNMALASHCMREALKIVELSRNGRTLTQSVFPMSAHENDLVWMNVCLGLVTLGFDDARPTDLDLATSVSYQIKQLQRKERYLRTCAAADLAKCGPRATPAIPVLVALMKRPNLDDNLLALDALSFMGPPAFPILLEASKDKRLSVRAQALECLAGFTGDSKTLVPLWFGAMDDKSPVIRLAAVQSLAKHLELRLADKQATETEEKAIVAQICKAMDDRAIVRIGQDRDTAPNSDDFRVIRPRLAPTVVRVGRINSHVFAILQSLGRKVKCVVPELAKALKGNDVDLRLRALSALQSFGPAGAAAIPELLDAFDGKGIDVPLAKAHFQWLVIETLVGIGPKAKTAVPFITTVLCDKMNHSRVRRMAAWALGEMGVLNESVERALITASEQDDEDLKKMAAKALETLRAKRR